MNEEDQLEEAIAEYLEYGTVTTEDGCQVEPDGVCSHGYSSPLLEAGLI